MRTFVTSNAVSLEPLDTYCSGSISFQRAQMVQVYPRLNEGNPGVVIKAFPPLRKHVHPTVLTMSIDEARTLSAALLEVATRAEVGVRA